MILNDEGTFVSIFHPFSIPQCLIHYKMALPGIGAGLRMNMTLPELRESSSH